MQRAMAQEAEALREKRARQIKAEAEVEARALLRQAAETIMHSPAGLELRRMQMITEVGAEQNTMTIIMMPSEFVEIGAGRWRARRNEPDPLGLRGGRPRLQPKVAKGVIRSLISSYTNQCIKPALVRRNLGRPNDNVP